MLELAWDSIDPFLIKLAFAFSAYLLFRPHMGIRPMITLLVIIGLLGEFDPLYWSFMTYWPEKNPQISTAIYACVLIPLVLGQLLIKKRRTADRVLMALGLCAMTVTTLLFHSLFIEGSMPSWAERINYENRVMMMLDEPAFSQACASQHRVCSVNGDIQSMPLSDSIRFGIEAIAKDTKERSQHDFIVHSYVEINDIQSSDLAFITYYADPNGRKVIAAVEQAEHAHRTIKQLFYFLASTAHMTWLMLICGLMLLHGRLMSRRKR
jgi:hypothetical protein